MRILLLCFGIMTIFAGPAWSQSYSLVWEDEFNGTQLDLAKWEPQIGTGCPSLCGWGNNELQYYRSQNATVSGGFLTITAKEESFGGQSYTSARLRTKNLGDWTYGRIEMRAKMPIGQGLWPAFWMLPTDETYGTWAASGEIDIMEYLGHQPDEVLGTLHYGGVWPGNQFSGNSFSLSSGTFNDDFHEFKLEWEPCEMRWYVDGALYATQNDWSSTGGPYPAPFNERFHLLLNLAVGGNLPGPPDMTTSFPQEMVVDWVRVYQKPDFSACRLEFADMDYPDLDPYANGWFSFGGSVGGGGISLSGVDLPPIEACRYSLATGWGSGGTPGFFGGFGRENPMDLTGVTHFTMWIKPNPGQDYNLEINLQDDDNGDNFFPATPDGLDDEFQYVFQVSPTGPDAISGGGWQRVAIPLTSFVDDNSYHYGGNGVFDPVPTGGGGNGQLINIVVAVIGISGSDVDFRTDRWAFTRQTSSIAGKVWEDTDGNGVLNGGEAGLSDVTVELFDVPLGQVVATRITTASGDYDFSTLLGAPYEVRIDGLTLPVGFASTHDPDGTVTPDVFAVELGCDEVLANQDFGYATGSTGILPGDVDLALLQNSPNPFNLSTRIAFQLPEAGSIQLVIYDVTGRRVRMLVDETRPAGLQEVWWDGNGDTGKSVSDGIYYYRLKTEEKQWVRRMTLLR